MILARPSNPSLRRASRPGQSVRFAVVVSMIAALGPGCPSPSPSPARLRSEPAPPTADLGGGLQEDEPPKVVVTVLTQMFERGRVGPPKVAASMRPGMPRSEAQEALKLTAGDPSPMITRETDGLDLDSVLHHLDPPVRIFAVSKDGVLVGINVSLPFEPATLALDDLWGSACPGPTTDEGKVTHVWTGSEWTARLLPVPDRPGAPAALKGRGLLELRPAG